MKTGVSERKARLRRAVVGTMATVILALSAGAALAQDRTFGGLLRGRGVQQAQVFLHEGDVVTVAGRGDGDLDAYMISPGGRVIRKDERRSFVVNLTARVPETGFYTFRFENGDDYAMNYSVSLYVETL